MSYILEALKKSEQERQIGQVPDLSVIQETPARAAPRWPRWLLAALLLNIVVLAVLAWRIWDARMSASLASSPPAPSDTQQTAQSAADAALESGTRGVDAVDASLSSAAAVPAQNLAPASGTVPAPELPEPVSHQPTPAPVPAQPLQPAAQAQTETQLGPDLEPLPPVDSVDAAAAVPRWEDLPDAQRAGLPVPRIDVHVFAQEPERRFVLIELRKYHQGDTLEDGAVIETILADGIVLSYQGRQYRVDRP